MGFSWEAVINIIKETKIKSSLIFYPRELSQNETDELEGILFNLQTNSYFYIGSCYDYDANEMDVKCDLKYVVTLDHQIGFAMDQVKIENGRIKEDFNLQVKRLHLNHDAFFIDTR